MLNWLNPFKDIISGLSGVEKVAGVMAAIWTDLTDVHMWASLGWLVLGALLLMLGLLMWLRKPVEGAAGTVAAAVA